MHQNAKIGPEVPQKEPCIRIVKKCLENFVNMRAYPKSLARAFRKGPYFRKVGPKYICIYTVYDISLNPLRIIFSFLFMTPAMLWAFCPLFSDAASRTSSACIMFCPERSDKSSPKPILSPLINGSHEERGTYQGYSPLREDTWIIPSGKHTKSY